MNWEPVIDSAVPFRSYTLRKKSRMHTSKIGVKYKKQDCRHISNADSKKILSILSITFVIFDVDFMHIGFRYLFEFAKNIRYKVVNSIYHQYHCLNTTFNFFSKHKIKKHRVKFATISQSKVNIN